MESAEPPKAAAAAAAAAADVILYTHKFSPFAQRVEIALKEKGIPFQPILVDLRNKPEELTDLNPIWGKVPTMKHGDYAIADSRIILKYLEEAWPGTRSLLPEDALGKARCRFWADYIYQGWNVLHKAGVNLIGGSADTRSCIEEGLKWLKTLNDAMAGISADGPFFMGDQFGYVDVVLAPLNYRSLIAEKMGGITIPGPDELPRLHKWFEATKAKESVRDTLPTAEAALEWVYFNYINPMRHKGNSQ